MRFVVGLVVLAGLGVGVFGGGGGASRGETEVVRLREHFSVVLEELRARDVSHLSAAQRAARR